VKQVIDPLRIIGTDPLRVACEVTVGVGERSKLTQLISLDADSPVVKFQTSVRHFESCAIKVFVIC